MHFQCLHSRKECQFFWLPGVPIGSLFPKTKWVPFGSPSQSLGVPIKFRDCAFAGQGPHFHPKKLLAPVIKGKVHLGNVYIAELWSASTQLNSCGLGYIKPRGKLPTVSLPTGMITRVCKGDVYCSEPCYRLTTMAMQSQG